MSKELPKTYDFKNTETAMYQWWWDQGYFKPINDPNSVDHDPDHKPYVISIPPPNVTGELHLGHAMFVSMEDLMIFRALVSVMDKFNLEDETEFPNVRSNLEESV